MEPNYEVDYALIFTAGTAVDTRSLGQLALFAGSSAVHYSDQQPDGFLLTRDGTTIEVDGEGFVYDGGVPVSGDVIGMIVMTGNALAFEFGRYLSEDSLPLPITAFFSSDPLAIAKILFAGNDIINGSAIDDTLYGFTGDDLISGRSGDDLVYGENGDDQLSGANGDDKLYGGNGDDWLTGGRGNDKLFGGNGFDIASFADKLSPVVVNLSKGKTVKAKIGFNEVDKLKGIDGVLGGVGDDKITGNGRDNMLGGNAGNDVLKGKGGNDVLVGGWGSDTLVGGKGEDTFLFDKQPAGGSFTDIDKIKDFTHGVDTLQFADWYAEVLSSILSYSGVLSAKNFHAAPGAFAGVGETYFVYDTTRGILYFDASGDGTGRVHQVAVLKGAPTLAASDFFIEAPDLIV